MLSSTLALRSAVGSPRRTWLRSTGIVPVRPEASLSLKSARPSKPSERQKRMTVGWLTSACAAMMAMASFSSERGLPSTTSATRRSAGVSESRDWRTRSSSGLCELGSGTCSASSSDRPRKAGLSAVNT